METCCDRWWPGSPRLPTVFHGVGHPWLVGPPDSVRAPRMPAAGYGSRASGSSSSANQCRSRHLPGSRFSGSPSHSVAIEQGPPLLPDRRELAAAAPRPGTNRLGLPVVGCVPGRGTRRLPADGVPAAEPDGNRRGDRGRRRAGGRPAARAGVRVRTGPLRDRCRCRCRWLALRSPDPEETPEGRPSISPTGGGPPAPASRVRNGRCADGRRHRGVGAVPRTPPAGPTARGRDTGRRPRTLAVPPSPP